MFRVQALACTCFTTKQRELKLSPYQIVPPVDSIAAFPAPAHEWAKAQASAVDQRAHPEVVPHALGMRKLSPHECSRSARALSTPDRSRFLRQFRPHSPNEMEFRSDEANAR